MPRNPENGTHRDGRSSDPKVRVDRDLLTQPPLPQLKWVRDEGTETSPLVKSVLRNFPGQASSVRVRLGEGRVDTTF